MASRATRFLIVAAAIAVAAGMSIPFSATVSLIEDASGAPVETVLRIGSLERIDSLNPYVGLNDMSYIFYGLVYDQLQAAGNDMERVPNLATEIRIVPPSDPELIASGEPYGSVWEYNITHNAYWTDGQPFTADDVVFNINLNAQNFNMLWAYQPYAYWMKEAVKVDDDTVRIHFYNRATGDPTPVAIGDWIGIPMLPKHLLENISPSDIGFSWTGLFPTENPPIVGTGMFMATSNIYSEWIAGDQITLVRNPNYHWAADYGKSVQFDKIVIRFFDESTAMSLALRLGMLDVAMLPPQTYWSIQRDVEDGTLQNVIPFDGPRPDQYFTQVGINMNNAGPNPSRLDPLIRRALETATNKTYITQNFYLGMASEGSTLISPVNSFWHYEPDAAEKFQYDRALASSMLEGAGYRDTNSDGVRECTASSYAVTHGLVIQGTHLTYEMLVCIEHPEDKDIAMYLDSTWSYIGVDVTYMIVDQLTLYTLMYSYAYDTVIWSWSSDPDPNYMLFSQTQAAWGGWSDNKYLNESYEDNYSLSVSELDSGQRKVRVDNCQKVHYLDAAYSILAYPYQTVAWRNDTFSGWGDWAADPGRSILNSWSANPLYFDLVPAPPPPNQPPTAPMIDASPDMVDVGVDVTFNASAADEDGDALHFFIDFGDGNVSEATALGGDAYPQYAEFRHAYSSTGIYLVTVWMDDESGLPGHNVSASCVVLVGVVIPEFPIILMPVAGMLAVFLFAGVSRRRRRPK